MKLRRMDDTSRYAVVIARQALDDAAFPLVTEGDDRVGVILGTFTAGGQPTTEYLTALHAGGPAGAPALLFNSTVGNAPASLAGLEYKLRGPNITVSLKEASSLSAIVTATDMLRAESRVRAREWRRRRALRDFLPRPRSVQSVGARRSAVRAV